MTRLAYLLIAALSVPLIGCDSSPDCPASGIAPGVHFDFSAWHGSLADLRVTACIGRRCIRSVTQPGYFQDPGRAFVSDIAMTSDAPVTVSLRISRRHRRLFAASTFVRPDRTEPYGKGCGYVWMGAVRAEHPNKLVQTAVPSA